MSEGLSISNVLENSIAWEMDIEAGDVILEIDGHKVEDILDLQYHTAEEEFTILLQKKNQEIWELEITKEPGEILGIDVEEVSTKGLQQCANNCIFCFVKQMPEGMRPSLYDKDDDYRLSVSQGSYITLSNLKPRDLERIVRLHISPLYISVHAWDPDVRKILMKNPRVSRIQVQIHELVQAGITLHTQVVLVPGYNDGKVLAETVEKLAEHYPAVQSIGVVPVGLTRYRDKLPDLRPVNPREASDILTTGAQWQKEFKKRFGKTLVYFSDELYILADREFPPLEEYDDLPQLENGIGMATKFYEELRGCQGDLPTQVPNRRVHLITGTSAFKLLHGWVDSFLCIPGLEINVHEVKNDFFGHTVTVAGLLTAGDIAKQVPNLQGDYFIIPKVMLKADESIFLDGYNVTWLEEQLNGKGIVVENDAKDFLEGILDRTLEASNHE